jgi:catechol 1,2-dioxygenase
MIIDGQQHLTQAVEAVMERTHDPRLRDIMLSLTRHLHGFVRETRLTEAEFRDACAIIAALGQKTNDSHNEVVLIAGSLGVSALVCLLDNGDNGTTETSQSLLGPFWHLNAPRVANGGSIVRHDTPAHGLAAPWYALDHTLIMEAGDGQIRTS